jgi:hypothetical protein
MRRPAAASSAPTRSGGRCLCRRAPRASSPGPPPARDITIGWATWTEFARDCGLSRLWGGVHFRSAIDARSRLGRRVGDVAEEFVRRHVTPLAPSHRSRTGGLICCGGPERIGRPHGGGDPPIAAAFRPRARRAA